MSSKRNHNIQQSNPNNFLIEGIKTIGLSLFLAFGIRTFAAAGYFIPSGSMEPTLQINDRLMVDKVSYHFKNPQRGDIVLFWPPEETTAACGLAQKSQDPFIKRVIGLPGEKIEIKERRVYVNSRPLNENYIADKPEYLWGPEIVPANSYLVLGDNRNNSCDGRYWGFVPRDHIIGRATVRYWPSNRIGILSEEQKP
ncbi:signal peptidase I [Brasilonema sp. UFV-L1]|uniref:signal peptidase I n=1 Tax=Brasilonema sp. UFV-L1 TaxID=2234130 RepID=UPI00145E7969|nr:signal peptidase I [Brasilonema sp. UFV-L1]NMG05633.1 signal peptidase I [Brasilonema sp. UFV-L1]